MYSDLITSKMSEAQRAKLIEFMNPFKRIIPNFNDQPDLKPFSSTLDKDKETKIWGYLKNGKIVIGAKFEEAMPFFNGKAPVKEDGRWGLINESGVYTTKPTFDEIKPFSEGLAAARVKKNGSYKWGYINPQGVFVIAPQFKSADNFSNDCAAVETFSQEKNCIAGYINHSGTWQIKPRFQFTMAFVDGNAIVGVMKNGEIKWGMINQSGSFIMMPFFNHIIRNNYGGIVAVLPHENNQ